ncbi:MAG: transporter substrate-binding domain-containing protein [Spirochaetaceae bacterium]|nr:transporter substrate-binding domain-containing protein [Spirochaetaceae bacterium]
MFLKKMSIILSIILISSVSGCSKKDTELIIEKENTQETTTSEIQQTETEEENKPLIAVSSSDTVQIFVREDGAPGMYLGDDGEVHGFYVDLEKMVMEEMDQSYKFVPYSDAGPVINGLKSGTHHLALAAPDLPGFRAIFDLSIPYEILHFVTFVQKGNNEIKGSTKEELLQSLHGKKVGVQTQGHIYESLRDIREIKLVEYPTTTSAMEDLNKGLLDAVPDVKRIGLYYAEQNNWEIKPVGQPIISHIITTAISKMFEPSLLNRYNSALSKIIADGRRDTLWESYFGPMSEEDKP